MSKLAIKGNDSGTATFTIEAPATSTDRTLTLPDEAGTVLTSASDYLSSTSSLQASNITGDITINGSVGAWAYWNTTTTHSLLNDYNISSISDGGTGITTLNFATPFANNNIALAGMQATNGFMGYQTTPSSTSITVRTLSDAGNPNDSSRNGVICCGDR